eukprot:scaffold1302_cov114-Isochrysis_galbana.AAC.17
MGGVGCGKSGQRPAGRGAQSWKGEGEGVEQPHGTQTTPERRCPAVLFLHLQRLHKPRSQARTPHQPRVWSASHLHCPALLLVLRHLNLGPVLVRVVLWPQLAPAHAVVLPEAARDGIAHRGLLRRQVHDDAHPGVKVVGVV